MTDLKELKNWITEKRGVYVETLKQALVEDPLQQLHPYIRVESTALAQDSVGQSVDVGDNCLTVHGSHVAQFSSVGDWTMIGKDVEIGVFCSIGVRCMFLSNNEWPTNGRKKYYDRTELVSRVTVGEGVVVGPGVKLADKTVACAHSIIGKGCGLHEGAMIGARAVLLNGVQVGKDSSVGHGTIVGKNVRIPAGVQVPPMLDTVVAAARFIVDDGRPNRDNSMSGEVCGILVDDGTLVLIDNLRKFSRSKKLVALHIDDIDGWTALGATMLPSAINMVRNWAKDVLKDIKNYKNQEKENAK